MLSTENYDYFGHSQDVVSKIMSFFEKGTRAVCILSATGAVSKVAIRQPSGSTAVRLYEVQLYK